MKGTLTLTNPITVNGEAVTALDYDTNEITVAMFAEADSKKKAGTVSAAAEFDFGLHTYLGIMAVVAVNDRFDVKDLERVKGPDAAQLMRIGRNFFTQTSAEPSPQSGSAEPSETTGEPITALAETLNDDD